MKTAEQRDNMVRLVQDAVKKWPTLADVPTGVEVSKGAKAVTVDVEDTPKDNRGYVGALYELGMQGAVPISRSKDSSVIIGEVAAAPGRGR